MEEFKIVGGTYYEWCEDPQWDELYGSGFRGAVALSSLIKGLSFETYADKETAVILEVLAQQINLRVHTHPIEKSIRFYYQHPLANPHFQHSSLVLSLEPLIVKNAENVLSYGMLEGNARVEAKHVVYDPQRPFAPVSFWANGSKAEELYMVLNYKEASTMSGSGDVATIRDYLFNHERVAGAIVKNGAEGAFVFSKDKPTEIVPAFETTRVWPIGSGDVFSAYFSFHFLLKGKLLYEAAYQASLATATYVNSRLLTLPAELPKESFRPFHKKTSKQLKLYLAGPFFTMAERWIVNEARVAFLKAGFDVFSPYHEVGIGEAKEVVPQDIAAIRTADIIAAIGDGLDAGTQFEIGYARASSKPVTAFVQNEKETSLTMLRGTECVIENDFSTWVYKTVWEAYRSI